MTENFLVDLLFTPLLQPWTAQNMQLLEVGQLTYARGQRNNGSASLDAEFLKRGEAS